MHVLCATYMHVYMHVLCAPAYMHAVPTGQKATFHVIATRGALYPGAHTPLLQFSSCPSPIS